ncbi:DUF4167 domain-containing protein [Phenylobacterium sp.]|uniref:DUF4167 domain-containing protein n=1 Tax=Phenylobacterium sp. TaxID=1871053 RepID=UPI00272FF357|nr:DUF4167 domain-containing protein [Phenylobacterium sp.]MDP1617025.1 DUF4167 domain-containing protein [Phenylobacterium sp.]MDP1986996.1 DUF4167 domain-containing protein [Phenylobacterium sp.]
MRDFKGMKRQRGRNRGGGGNKPQQHNANRAFDSNGPDGVKVRGNAQHVFEKYQQLARDATSSSDRVLAENYLQHAEHYFRLLRAMQPQRSPSEILGRDQVSSGLDIDFEDESGQQQVSDAPEGADNESDNDSDRNGRDRDQNRRDDNRRDDRSRDDRARDDRPRDDRPRDDRQRDDQPREDRARDDRSRDENRPPRRERWRDRDENRRERTDRSDRPERDPLAVVEPQAAPLVAETPAPDGPMLRDAEGGASEAPAFLQAPRSAEPKAEGEEPVRKPRRRRAPRSFEGGEGGETAPPSSETEEA